MPLFISQEKPWKSSTFSTFWRLKNSHQKKQNKTVQPTDLQLNPQRCLKANLPFVCFKMGPQKFAPSPHYSFVDLFIPNQIPIYNYHGFFIGVCWGSNYLITAQGGDPSCWHLRTFVALLALLALLFAALGVCSARLVSWLVGIRWDRNFWKTWYEK